MSRNSNDGSFDGWENARDELEKDGWISGLLFRCLHCGGYRLIVEAG
ncbi:MAG: CbrC family protein [Eggerthellaceae bacterium]|nr:CbrC family protein [Eggerthellaceae bacterium]